MPVMMTSSAAACGSPLRPRTSFPIACVTFFRSVAQIFEGLQRRRLPRPAHAGNDDELRGSVRLALTPANQFSHRVRHLLHFAAQGHGEILAFQREWGWEIGRAH